MDRPFQPKLRILETGDILRETQLISLGWYQIFGYYKLNGWSLFRNDMFQRLNNQPAIEK
jgi:hypothetical protein